LESVIDLSFRLHCGPGIDSASNITTRGILGVKAAGAYG